VAAGALRLLVPRPLRVDEFDGTATSPWSPSHSRLRDRSARQALLPSHKRRSVTPVVDEFRMLPDHGQALGELGPFVSLQTQCLDDATCGGWLRCLPLSALEVRAAPATQAHKLGELLLR
jgi:hypothetical protein